MSRILLLSSLLGILGALLLSPIAPVRAAEPPRVENISFYEYSGIVTISYDLIGDPGKGYKIILEFSDDGGTSFGLKPRTMSGDVGKKIAPGKGHKITWSLANDYPGTSSNRFVCQIRAYQPGKTWPWLLGTGAAIAGGAAYYLTRPEEPTTGTLSVTIPGHP